MVELEPWERLVMRTADGPFSMETTPEKSRSASPTDRLARNSFGAPLTSSLAPVRSNDEKRERGAVEGVRRFETVRAVHSPR